MVSSEAGCNELMRVLWDRFSKPERALFLEEHKGEQGADSLLIIWRSTSMPVFTLLTTVGELRIIRRTSSPTKTKPPPRVFTTRGGGIIYRSVLIDKRRGLDRSLHNYSITSGLCDGCGRRLFLLIVEEEEEKYADEQGIAGEDEPNARPIAHLEAVFVLCEAVDHRLRAECADRSADTVGHQHEQTLRTGANGRITFLIYEQRTRDIEEVEGYTVDNHGDNEEHHAGEGRNTDGEEAETQHPSEHGNEHNGFNTEAFQEEGDEQNAERLTDLRQRDQNIGMLHEPLSLKGGIGAKTTDEGIGKSVGNLQTYAEEHGKEEEQGHALVAEEFEGVESHSFDQAFSLVAGVDRAGRQGQCVAGQQQTPSSRDKKLHIRVLPTQKINNPHRSDEAYCAKDANGREIFHGVEA